MLNRDRSYMYDIEYLKFSKTMICSSLRRHSHFLQLQVKLHFLSNKATLYSVQTRNCYCHCDYQWDLYAITVWGL